MNLIRHIVVKDEKAEAPKARKAASIAEQRPLRTARAKTTVGRDQRK